MRKVGHSAKNVGDYIKLQKHRARDRALIAVSQAHEVRYWSKKFKVSPAKLKAAVKVAGHSSEGRRLSRQEQKEKAVSPIRLALPGAAKTGRMRLPPAELRVVQFKATRSAMQPWVGRKPFDCRLFAHCAGFLIIPRVPRRCAKRAPVSLLCARGCANMPARAALPADDADENSKEE